MNITSLDFTRQSDVQMQVGTREPLLSFAWFYLQLLGFFQSLMSLLAVRDWQGENVL